MGEPINRAKSIFLAAIDGQAPEQWSAFLDQACAGDASLRAEVQRLLRAHVALGSFHEAPGSPLVETVEYPLTEHPGGLVGPYRLLQQIGEGGMGVVFLAEQEEPVRRRVALKIIKPGLDTGTVLARFEVERQALALMDHPNIAKVLDAGATEDGRPFFVMELVRGGPITDFCDQNQLPPEARLKLFIDVCRAIQHAHHKGLIHRDIKPSNVLVTLCDSGPVVKVIDFGVAKATVQKLTERTLFTAYGQMIGTPVYMSPEQAASSGLDIDTRSDVYALGVLLYELLTGTTPLEDDRLREAGHGELLRLIREEEAPRPSTRLSSLGDAAAVLAGNRGLDARRLAQLLAGDLDWIVMKALEKDRNRRYDAPGGFAEDVGRYLRGEAVLARPPSLVYKVKKFVLRNRRGVLTAAAVAAALLGGTAAATWQAVQATRAKQEALAALAAEKEAKESAQAEEAKARVMLEFFEDKVLAAARPAGWEGGLGREVTLAQAVEAALPFVESRFRNQPLLEARLRLSLGTSFLYQGEARKAAEQYETARTLYARHLGPEHPDTLASMNLLGSSYAALGRHADAVRLREQTLSLRTATLGADHPDTLVSMNNLANSYEVLGRPADALGLRQQTLALRQAKLGPDHPDTILSMHNLASGYAALGRHAEAAPLHERTLGLLKAKFGPDHPFTLRCRNNLAYSYAALGRRADAADLFQETLALMTAKLGPEHPDTLASMNNLANAYGALGRHANAVELQERALALRQAKLGPEHPDTITTMHNLANSYEILGRPADGLRLREQALPLMRARFSSDHPYTLINLRALAEDLVKLDRSAEAVPFIDELVQRETRKRIVPSLLPGVMILRLRHFEKAREATGCRQTAEMWENLNRTDADSLYNAACMRAVTAAVLRASDTSPEGAKRADAETDRAMTWLKQAVAAGYKNVAHMKQDTDLDALRDRADFTKLVTTLDGIRD
jgi:serine/threonine protein kinase/tetratricopeptide (TPR) repeat protein